MQRTVFLCSRKRAQHYIINITQIKSIGTSAAPTKGIDTAIKAIEDNNAPSQDDIIALNNQILQMQR